MKIEEMKDPKKKVRGRLKRGLAAVMAALLTVSAPMPGLSTVSHAAGNFDFGLKCVVSSGGKEVILFDRPIVQYAGGTAIRLWQNITISGFLIETDQVYSTPASDIRIEKDLSDGRDYALGTMPESKLTWFFPFKVDADKNFTLKVKYQTESGIAIKDELVEYHNALDLISVRPADIAGYSVNKYLFEDGKEPKAGASVPLGQLWAEGEPAGNNGWFWDSRMPNTDVTLVYVYSVNPYTITERYVDKEASDPAFQVIEASTRPAPVAAGAPVNGEYRQPYGYGAERPFSISYTPENPSGPGIAFGGGGDLNLWSGVMPAADVEITYNHTRIPGLWANIMYKAGAHGSLSAAGASSDLRPAPDSGAEYEAGVLRNDGSVAGNAAAYTLEMLRTKKLMPTPVPETGTLYKFAGWFVDGNGNGIVDDGETLLPDGHSFTGDTVLTAGFEEQAGAWMDIHFAAKKAGLNAGEPEILHIPRNTSWGEITDRLPAYTVWTGYRDGGWQDEAGAVMTADRLPEAGKTYTITGIPDSLITYTVTAKYTNRDGTIVFQETEAPLPHSIEDAVAAAKIQVPGYVWNKNNSGTAPAAYQFDPADEAAAIGAFNDDGGFTGRMPGQPLTVFFRYDVKPAPSPEDKPFHLTIRYESENGGTLALSKTAKLNAEEAITEAPAALEHYDCDGFRFVKGDQAAGASQPVQSQPDLHNGYSWNAKMPNQDVELIYLYKGKEAAGSKFRLTENYMDVTDPAHPSLISTTVRSDISVDHVENGGYEKPYGYVPQMPFTIGPETEGLLTNLAFGKDGNDYAWSGAMPAGNVTVTYNNTRNLTPADPARPYWAALTYERTDHGTLSAATLAEVTAVHAGAVYNAQILVSDGTAEGNANAYTWESLKEKKLVPTATPDPYYEFAGWYIDSNGNGRVDPGEMFLGKGDDTDPEAANQTFFTGNVTLLAAFAEIPEQWIDISFDAVNGSLEAGSTSLHVQADKTWGEIRDRLPIYRAWVHYTDDGWFEGETRMTAGMALTGGQTYSRRFIPGSRPEDMFTYTTKYTNRDGTIVFQETEDPLPHSIEDAVAAAKIQVPGYVWNKNNSGTSPEAYQFNPADGAAAIGAFNDDGGFTGRMPGQPLTVFFRYDVKPAPLPEDKPFRLTIRYESENGGTLALSKTAKLNAEEAITEAPVSLEHYDCDGFRFVKGDQAAGASQPVQSQPDLHNGYSWNAKMPNQDVELIYLYKGKEAAGSKFRLTENYMDVTDPAHPSLISTTVRSDISVDHVENGGYEQPYGYVPQMPFTIGPETEGLLTNLAFGKDGNDFTWSGAMPAGNVTVTYNNTRNLTPADPARPYWAAMTYRGTANGTLSSVSQEVAAADHGAGYKAQILVSDGTQLGNANAYTWEKLKEKHLVPTASPDPYYTFTGWYIDGNGNGRADPGETFLGRGDDTDPAAANQTFFTGDTTLLASFEELPDQWIDVSFDAVNGRLENGSVSLHVQADKTWGEIRDRLPVYEPWNHYRADGWYAGEIEMTSDMALTGGQTYTCRFVPNPDERFHYTVEYTDEDGTLLFGSQTDLRTYPISAPVSAALKPVDGYEWVKERSGTAPEAYPFDPGTAAAPVGSFDTDGSFTGIMPGENLTVSYRFRLKAAAAFKLNVLYQSESGGNVRAPAAEEMKKPGEAIYTRPEPVEGYSCTGFRFLEGKADHREGDGALLLPAAGEPREEEGYRWESRMPNQAVTLVYLYKGDENARYKLTERYADDDAGAGLTDIVPPKASGPYPAEQEVNGRYVQPYGYEKTGQSIALSSPWDGDMTLAFRPDRLTSNDFSGQMPPRDVEIVYHNRRAAESWKELTYLPGREHGRLAGHQEDPQGVSGDVREAGSKSYKASILINDGLHGGESYSLAKITEKKLAPKPVADKYYRFAGWFGDTNGNGVPDGDETFFGADRTFSGPATLTAGFEEDPDQWIDIRFAGENAVINGGQIQSLHTTADKTWGEIAADLPAYTPLINYKADGWYGEGETEKMTDDRKLVNGRTYTIVCYPDSEVFGTKVESPRVSGGLDGQGKGKITVYSASEELYQYILTDPDGRILMAQPQRAAFQRVEFNGLHPGTRYEIYEAVRELPAPVGGQILGLGVEGKTISQAARTLTPVVTDNYRIYYDEESGDEVKTRLVIRPADPDTEYALLDESGREAVIPGVPAGGWMSPSGDGSLQIGGLEYNASYTLTARPKGQTGLTAESRRAEGSAITTDPVGEPKLTKYVIETVQGQIVRVGDAQVGENRYEAAAKGDLVTLSAEALNDAGEPFLYWKTTIGPLDWRTAYPYGEAREITFPMPAGNLVLTAVYGRQPEQASPSNASVTDEVRGGSRQEIALDPGVIREKEGEVTREKDRELMDKNGAKIMYKVVYQKNGVKPREISLVKASDAYGIDHEPAFHAAWGLNITLERYVNGRRVELKPTAGGLPAGGSPSGASPSNGTPSNAKPETGMEHGERFRTYIQMGTDDVDMMDYQLFQIETDPDGNFAAAPVALEGDPEAAGGLFTFEARVGSRYVMVYSRAYYLSFTNELPLLDSPRNYQFKVRRGESPADERYYGEGFASIPEPPSCLISKSGGEYNYQGWSYSPARLSPFDPSGAIRKTTRLYARYRDNEKQVAQERKNLEAVIEEAWKLSEDPFMKRLDSKALKADISGALNVLQEEEPRMALEEELLEAKEKLLEEMKQYKEQLKKSHQEYQSIRSRTGGGGSAGGGGGGKGVLKNPFTVTPDRNYVVGTNGSWQGSALPGGEKKMSFVLNGGTPLRSMWGWLRHPIREENENGWYYFDNRGIMNTGWVLDSGKWYYCYQANEGPLGKMATGWYKSPAGQWYYLEPSNGQMVTGWRQIGGEWYYFERVGTGASSSDGSDGGNISGGHGRPQGSMYQGEMTPDGYQINENGAWIQ